MGSVDTLFYHETGCKSCGLAKPPLTSKTTMQKKKKFDEPGICEIEGTIKDAGTYESEFKKIKIVVKDKVVKDDVVKDKVVKDDVVNGDIVKDDVVNGDIVKDEIVKDDVINGDVIKDEIVKDVDKNIINTDESNEQIPIVIEVFTHYGCPICEHVDEGVKKLLDEYKKRTKTIIMVGHVIDKDIRGTIDRINEGGLVYDLSVIMKSPDSVSACMLKIEYDETTGGTNK